MTVLERRVRMATAILNDLNEKDFSEMERFFKDLKTRQKPEPCMYTVEEIRKFLPKRERDIAEGRGIPHDEVMKEYGL
ncbi:MAG: hypothetical protein LBV74_01400 [Tannerella sp.]|jgi:hypothetical protein|nr:hypothetical protein [Tannerella sp.]